MGFIMNTGNINRINNNINNIYFQQQQIREKPVITEMRKIIYSQDPNKREILGELIFYYLKSFIIKYSLNTTLYTLYIN